MFHSGFLCHCQGIKEKFKISKENLGDKLVITFTGDKKNVEILDKKIDAAHTLMEGCCENTNGKSCC
ncbi:MAG: hypothetical protein PHR00_02735 [Patescibacteria group bacterium]|nr:hypothetical protein [Patescibacteria group bacterium]